MANITGSEFQYQSSKENSKLKSNSKRPRSKLSSKTSTQEIAFVNLTGSSGPIQDAEKRRTVRAHVMREYQRKKQQEESRYRRSYQYPFVDPPGVSSGTEHQVLQLEDTTKAPNSEQRSNFLSADQGGIVESWNNYLAQGIGSSTSHQVETKWNSLGKLGGDYEVMNNNHSMTNQPANIIINLNFPGDFLNIRDIPTLNTISVGKETQADQENSESQLVNQNLTLKLSFNALNSGKLDPFNAIPGLRNAKSQALMHHYNQVLVNTLIPVNPKDKWFNFAISDEALFHATMLHSAAHHSMLVGNNELAEPSQLNSEAIRILNLRLGDPSQGVSDLTIAAVACLILFENQSGNISVSNIHMAGLLRMIQLRGGIETLGLSGVLKRKVLWADVCNAMLSNRKPRFNLHQEGISLTMTSSEGNLEHFPHTSAFCNCETQLTDIIADLQTLSDNPPINALDGLISDNLYLVERRLVVLITSFSESNHKSYCHSVSKACFLAALIYLYSCLRDYPVQAPLFDSFVTSLREALFSSGYEQDWQPNNYSLLVWILTAGALNAVGRPERSRFVHELADIVKKMGITRFQEFADTARRIVWIDREDVRREAAWRSLWWEIEALTGPR